MSPPTACRRGVCLLALCVLLAFGVVIAGAAALASSLPAGEGAVPLPLCLVLESVAFSDDSMLTREKQTRLLASVRELGLFEVVAAPDAATLCPAPVASLWLRGTWTTEDPPSNLPRALVHGFSLLLASRLLPLRLDGTLLVEAILVTPNGRRFDYEVREQVSGEYTIVGPWLRETEHDMNERAWSGAMVKLGRHLAQDTDGFVGVTGVAR